MLTISQMNKIKMLAISKFSTNLRFCGKILKILLIIYSFYKFSCSHYLGEKYIYTFKMSIVGT